MYQHLEDITPEAVADDLVDLAEAKAGGIDADGQRLLYEEFRGAISEATDILTAGLKAKVKRLEDAPARLDVDSIVERAHSLVTDGIEDALQAMLEEQAEDGEVSLDETIVKIGDAVKGAVKQAIADCQA